ncbi:MAG: tetratricopeptide repeat protein [Rhizobiaceae bacterium]|nr:tetratricopeptide repeat protein [Rhizobiaceae bacterium]
MEMRATRVIAAALFASVLAGCSTTNLTAHSSAFDHKDVDQVDNVHMDDDDRGVRFRPRADHVSLKGDGSRAFLVSGQEHFKQQNFGLAEESFRKAVEARTDSPGAWLGLAASLDQLGKFREADTAYKQVSLLKSNNARVYNNWGYSFLLRGDYQKARTYLNRAQTIDPNLEEVQGNLHLLEKTISG